MSIKYKTLISGKNVKYTKEEQFSVIRENNIKDRNERLTERDRERERPSA